MADNQAMIDQRTPGPQGAGYLTVACKGFEEVKGVITDYLEKERPLPRR